jgi:site-specific DNA-methyltransferase (adenine-specific)
MAAMPENSVDAIVCDPPYGLEFMGKEWDRLGGAKFRKPTATDAERGAGGVAWSASTMFATRNMPDAYVAGTRMQEWHQRWATEALRVAKPGAYLLAFGGTRTYHRLVVAVEDAGWIIRDCLVWAYASGFPKGKANLKPAWEPIVMARKPGPLRPLAIDACRIGVDERTNQPAASLGNGRTMDGGAAQPDREPIIALGRWPSNVILTDPIFDGDVDGVVGGGETSSGSRNGVYGGGGYSGDWPDVSATIEGDTGTYSRFFLIPKAARSQREPVFGDVTARRETAHRRTGPMDTPFLRGETVRRNPHPTVKPIDLMRHLVRLVTPSGGTVLDPFLGSGTTAIAAEMEGFDWLGIEREAEYVAIAEARLMGVQRGLGLSA